MVVTKLSKRKRRHQEWLINDTQVFDLTEDGGDSDSLSLSEFDAIEDGRQSSSKLVASPFDQEIMSDNQEERKSLSFSSRKNSPVVKYTRESRVPGPIPSITELENQSKKSYSQIVLPVHSIQPGTDVNRLYLKFSTLKVEVRGGDNKKSLVYEWPLQDIVGICIRYRSKWEEDTRALVIVRVSVPFPLSGSSEEIDEYVLELLKFRDSVDDILKLSPIFRDVMKEDVGTNLRAVEIPNSPTCTSMSASSSEEEDVEKTAWSIEMLNSQTCTSMVTPISKELDEAITAFKVLVYPPNDPDAVTITQQDIKILNPLEFLNDTIIDFYIKYLQQTIVPSEKMKRLHFFNSFFFSKLAESDTCGLAAFERVRKWTRKVNIFEKDFIFIPVNQSLHWSLIIICHPGRTGFLPASAINAGSSDGDACILHLNSMEGCHRGVEGHIKNYLLQEWLERNKDPSNSEDAEIFFSEMPFRHSKVPQQDNNCDCGLFLLHYVELFLKTAPSVYRMRRQSSPPTQFLRRNWFKPSEASAKRSLIQKLIIELSQGERLESGGGESAIRDNAQNGVFPAGGEATRPWSMLYNCSDIEQSAAQSSAALDRRDSDSANHSEEPPSENRSVFGLEDVELDEEPGIAESCDGHDRVQLVAVSTDDAEIGDRSGALLNAGSDQSKVRGYESCTHQPDDRIVVVDDDLKSGPEAVHSDDQIWNFDKCPLPSLPLQVKPLQLPTLLDEHVPLCCRPSPIIDLEVEEGWERSDDPSPSFSNADEGARAPQKQPPLLHFGSILSPEEEAICVEPGNDDDTYESSYCDAQQLWGPLNLQSEERKRPSSAVPSESDALTLPDDCSSKEDGHTGGSGRRPVRFRNKSSPSGRCSESNMQPASGARRRGQRKHSKHSKDTGVLSQEYSITQSYGFKLALGREEVQEVQELSSDDSSDSIKGWDKFKTRSPELSAKRPSGETQTRQRVTRSVTESTRGLTLSAEKQMRKSALEDLHRKKSNRR